ncbi:hypothetical protein CMI37_17825 [Candidatus Pacearchaeota archaeon]|nr:hypothetical protein [Candidatus Pacearchaeota archaeon]
MAGFLFRPTDVMPWAHGKKAREANWQDQGWGYVLFGWADLEDDSGRYAVKMKRLQNGGVAPESGRMLFGTFKNTGLLHVLDGKGSKPGWALSEAQAKQKFPTSDGKEAKKNPTFRPTRTYPSLSRNIFDRSLHPTTPTVSSHGMAPAASITSPELPSLRARSRPRGGYLPAGSYTKIGLASQPGADTPDAKVYQQLIDPQLWRLADGGDRWAMHELQRRGPAHYRPARPNPWGSAGLSSWSDYTLPPSAWTAKKTKKGWVVTGSPKGDSPVSYLAEGARSAEEAVRIVEEEEQRRYRLARPNPAAREGVTFWIENLQRKPIESKDTSAWRAWFREMAAGGNPHGWRDRRFRDWSDADFAEVVAAFDSVGSPIRPNSRSRSRSRSRRYGPRFGQRVSDTGGPWEVVWSASRHSVLHNFLTTDAGLPEKAASALLSDARSQGPQALQDPQGRIWQVTFKGEGYRGPVYSLDKRKAKKNPRHTRKGWPKRIGPFFVQVGLSGDRAEYALATAAAEEYGWNPVLIVSKVFGGPRKGQWVVDLRGEGDAAAQSYFLTKEAAIAQARDEVSSIWPDYKRKDLGRRAKKNPTARGFTFQHADMNEDWATWAEARQGVMHRGQGSGPGSWPVGAQANPKLAALVAGGRGLKMRDLPSLGSGSRGGYSPAERDAIPASFFLKPEVRRWPVADEYHFKRALQYMTASRGNPGEYPLLLMRLAKLWPVARHRALWKIYSRNRAKIQRKCKASDSRCIIPTLADLRDVRPAANAM